MEVLKRIFNFYLNSSIHVAIAAYSLVWVTLIELNLDYDKYLLCFVFFASITGYNFVKYFGVVKFHHRSLASWLKAIQVFSFIAFLAMCYYVLKLETETLILILILGIITFFYAIPIMVPKRYLFDDHKNLRQVSGLKIYLIALIWMFTTVILPIVNHNVLINSDMMITSIQRFSYVLVLMLPFEIRDLNFDSLKLATIPQKIGVVKTKIIGVILLVVFLILEFFKDELIEESIIATLTITFITLLFLLFSNKNQSKYYSAFWVESLPIVWLLILLLLG
ncbi:UbiA prenyltransferase family protein [Winogradskyella thalassocola]|uniref:UbiA prenyltransferase family protein n=1 Tax=Winogradskyella thalassocola TaxID=262004 RepID=A0A1G8HUE6_9FLAO|nr:hypothetical protein [Winogradskyella thalassocola]SDI10315.1 hypothetical protein SAMN04489796_10754 [Winogradskyella thalassocola]